MMPKTESLAGSIATVLKRSVLGSEAYLAARPLPAAHSQLPNQSRTANDDNCIKQQQPLEIDAHLGVLREEQKPAVSDVSSAITLVFLVSGRKYPRHQQREHRHS